MTTVTGIKEKPILFSGEMVRAILRGAKTQTRRVMKPQPKLDSDTLVWGRRVDTWVGWARGTNRAGTPHPAWLEDCPYGSIGDQLWVRETWTPIPNMKPSGYFTDPKWINRIAWYEADNDKPTWGGKWRPSIHMPRSACRLVLEITEVRVERLQSISEEDAAAEGVDAMPSAPAALTHRTSFAKLWDRINGKKHPWASNCWVWAITFERKVA
jgi:hypothetical protein